MSPSFFLNSADYGKLLAEFFPFVKGEKENQSGSDNHAPGYNQTRPYGDS
jgi:hypothetical protein